MTKQRITKKWLKNHMTYSWWKYAVLAAVCILGVNLVFTMTAYRVPEEKKVEVFVLNGYTDSVAMQETLWPAFSALYPEQEELTVMNVNLSGNDTYGPMQFATYIEKKMHTVPKRLVFVVGGPYGFSEAVYKAAAEKISLSKMTFSHQMIRLIFVEQIYRAMTILNNEPYHHE